MATSEPTLIRGADGALYFLAPGELDTYRVPDEAAAGITDKLTAIKTDAQAAETDDAEVSGFSFSRRLSPTSLGLTGIRPTAPLMGDDDKTQIIEWSPKSLPGDMFSF